MKKNVETLAFLRREFAIPKKFKLSWGLVEETCDGQVTVHVAVLLEKSRVYLDVEERRFYRRNQTSHGVQRVVCAAKKMPYDLKNYYFMAEKPNGQLFGRFVARNFLFQLFYGTKYEDDFEKMP